MEKKCRAKIREKEDEKGVKIVIYTYVTQDRKIQ